MSTVRPRGTVLVLEDDPGIGRLQRLQLERAGFHVELTTSTSEARARMAARGKPFQLKDWRA